MKYKIKYHDISGDWLIFDMGENFELIAIHSSEKDAKQHVKHLQSLSEKHSRWSGATVSAAA